LQSINANEIIDETPVLICADNSITDLKQWAINNITTYAYDTFIITDEHENFMGYVERNKLMNSAPNDNGYSVQNIFSKDLPVAHIQQDLASVSELMGSQNMQLIAVIAGNKSLKVKGIISAADILEAYSSHQKKESDYRVSISLKRRTKKLMIKGRSLLQSR